MKSRLWFVLPLGVVVTIGASENPGRGQAGSPGKSLTARGKISALKDRELKMVTPSGDVLVTLVDTTNYTTESPIKLSEIKTGLYLGTTARKQPDGTFVASEVRVFADDERGLSEGHRPSSSVPNSTMTNASVERVEDVVVQEIRGRMMTLTYKGGEIKVFVPPNIPIVKRVPGERGLLMVGATISVQGDQAADGTIRAAQVTIRAATN